MGCLKDWSVLVVGGDAREVMVCRGINQAGGRAELFGQAEESPDLLRQRLPGRWLVAPVSGIGPGGRIKTPHGWLTVSPPLASLGDGVVAGAVDDGWRQAVSVPVIAYRELDAFAWANAVPTAEGALAWVLARTGRTLQRARVGLAGFGRVAEITAPRLHALGARVRVLARHREDRAHAEALGYSAAPLSGTALEDLDFLLNTIPAPIFDRALITRFPPTGQVLDLASPPGGFTPEARALLAERFDWHPSLPGEAAPDTAAAIICETLQWICPAQWQAEPTAVGRHIST